MPVCGCKKLINEIKNEIENETLSPYVCVGISDVV